MFYQQSDASCLAWLVAFARKLLSRVMASGLRFRRWNVRHSCIQPIKTESRERRNYVSCL
jgi:hypothetical protein